MLRQGRGFAHRNVQRCGRTILEEKIWGENYEVLAAQGNNFHQRICPEKR